MTGEDYARFLPSPLSELAGLPVEERWLAWCGHRVRVERVGDPASAAAVVILHGAGGNSAAMRPYAAMVARAGALAVVPDLPGYGATETRPGRPPTYQEWRELAAEMIASEAERRRVLAMGASIGGLLAWEAAALSGVRPPVLATCLIDPSDARVRSTVARWPALGRVALPLMRVVAGPFARLRIPIRWLAKLSAMSKDPDLVRLVLSDGRGGGSRVALGFLRSYLESTVAIAPEDHDGGPVILAHPSDDSWTPVALSLGFLRRIRGETTHVPLENCGHFPVEEPGVRTLQRVVEGLVRERA